MPISLKIDVTKIDKARLFQGKNGAKYLDCVLIETPDGKFDNDWMICQSVSKEEREAGTRGAILGNGKNIGGSSSRRQPQQQPKPSPIDDADVPPAEQDDVPF